MRSLIAVAVLMGLCGAALAADPARVGDIVIREAWVRASLGNAPNSAAYMTLEATGDATDRLIGGETPVAERVELHTHLMEDGIARMRPVEAIEVAPEGPTVLAPGGLHLMLFGLTEKLEPGATMPLTLTFENAGSVDLEVPIRGMAAGMRHGGSATEAPGPARARARGRDPVRRRVNLTGPGFWLRLAPPSVRRQALAGLRHAALPKGGST